MPGGLAGPDRERRPPSDPRDLTVLILKDVNIGRDHKRLSGCGIAPAAEDDPGRKSNAHDQRPRTFKRLMSIACPPGFDSDVRKGNDQRTQSGT